jgi:hypothetical protein
MKLHLLLPAFVAVPMLLGSEPLTVTEANARTFYLQYARLTKEPHRVALGGPAGSVLCRAAIPATDRAEAEKRLGPHFAGTVHYYANPEAARTLQQSGTEFPEGSVIVKEKLGLKAKPADPDPVLEIGGMVKRAKGFDPANGDWEYFFHDQSGKLTTGKLLANCAACHNSAVADHVFAAWRFAQK